jgi:hypothetical protein
MSEKESNTVSKFLNSPFFVTVVGGAFITLLSLLWQSNSASLEQRKAEELKLFEAKQELFVEFGDSFPVALNLAFRFKERELWLEVQQHEKEKGHFPDGRNFDETRAYYEKMQDEYFGTRAVESMIAQIVGMFDGESVKEKAKKLDRAFDGFIEAEKDKELKKLYGEADDLYQELIVLMGKEIKRNEKP